MGPTGTGNRVPIGGATGSYWHWGSGLPRRRNWVPLVSERVPFGGTTGSRWIGERVPLTPGSGALLLARLLPTGTVPIPQSPPKKRPRLRAAPRAPRRPGAAGRVGTAGSGAEDAPRSTAPGAAPPPPPARRRGGSQEERPRVTPAVTSRRGGAGGDTRLSAGGGEPSRDRTRRHPACDPRPRIQHPKSAYPPPPAPRQALSSPDRATALPSAHRARGPPERFCTERAPSDRAPPPATPHRPRTGGPLTAPAPHRTAPPAGIAPSRQHRERAPFPRAAPAPPPLPVPVPVRSAPSMSLSSAVSMSLAARSSRANPSRAASSKPRALIAAALTGGAAFRTGGAARAGSVAA